MKLENITVENYRQFEKAELNFDEGITILAGANNSGKTSLINLIKNVLIEDKGDYNVSDVPAKNINDWINWAYPVFYKFFISNKTVEAVDEDLVNMIIPKNDTELPHVMDITSVKIHVSYNPNTDDIKLFADYIMDLDQDKHDFFFLYNYEIVRTRLVRAIADAFFKIKRRFKEIDEDNIRLAHSTDEKQKDNINVKERYLKQLIATVYKGNIIKNLIMDCQSYTKYRPNETTGGIFVSWRRKEELPTGA